MVLCLLIKLQALMLKCPFEVSMIKSIKKKLYIYILPVIIITLLLSYYISVSTTKKVVLEQINLKVESNKREQATKITDAIINAQNTTKDLAIAVSNTYEYVPFDEYEKLLYSTILPKNYVQCIGIWFEPNIVDTTTEYPAIAIGRKENILQLYSEYTTEKYDYYSQNFYNECKESGNNIFTKAYYDKVTGDYIITNVSPMYNDYGEFIGCVSADFEINKLQELTETYISEEIDFYIIDSSGLYLCNEDIELVANNQNILDDKNTELSQKSNEILENNSGSFIYQDSNEHKLLFYDTVPTVGWKLIYVVPLDSITEPLDIITFFYIAVIILVILVLFLVIRFVANNIVHRPVEALLKEFESITSNNYNTEIPIELIKSNDEFSVIGYSLGIMKISLKNYQSELESQNKLLLSSEQSLMNSISYNKAIVEALPQLLLIFDKNGYCLDCQGSKVFESRNNDFYKNKHISQLVGTEYKKLLDAFQNVKEKETIYGIEYQNFIEGKNEHLSANISYLDEKRIVLLVTKVTELYEQLNNIKQFQVELQNQNKLLVAQEEELQELVEYNKAIISALPQLMFVFTKDGYCLDCKGKRVFESRGHSYYIGKHLSEILVFDNKKVLKAFQDIKEGEVISDIEIQYTVENTSEYFSINVSSLGGCEVVILVTKITGLKEQLIEIEQYKLELENQNKTLVESTNNLEGLLAYNKAIISALPEMLYIFDRDGNIKDCQCAKGVSVNPPEYYIGKHARDVIDSNVVETFLKIFKEIKPEDELRKIDFSYRLNGKLEYISMNITYCRNNEILVLGHKTTELYEQLERIKHLSYNDIVTNISNRRKFDEVLNRCLTNEMFPLSIITSDVNGLKLINDSFGHEEGDNFLMLYADILKNLDVDKEYIARTGGDEFTIILPNIDKDMAQNVVDKLMKDCSEKSIHGINLSVSFGVGTMYNSHESIANVLKSAEDSMYQQKIYESTSRKDNTIEIINSTLQAKNPREQLHSDRVSKLCEKTAICLGMPKVMQSKLKTAGLLHDIGKIGVSEDVLNKPGKLTNEEFEEIQKHPEIGFRILEASGNMQEISECVLSHHERWDGNGYPRGLKGEEISIEARIIAIADTYDAMTSQRSYRQGLSKEIAIAELIKCKDAQFEASLVDIFINEVLSNDI